jgi:phosphate-selective porin OprO/OprP
MVLLAIIGALTLGQRVWADDTNAADEIGVLRQQIDSLDQKVRILERQREVDRDAATDSAKEAVRTMPVITAGANGFSFRSADTNFMLALHGLVDVDSRSFFEDHGLKGNDGFILRRARPILQGTVFRDFDFLFVPDFGGSTVQIQDAYLNYRFSPELQLQGGKFKSPVGLEQLQSDTAILFNERSLATDLVPNRDLGVELHGDLFGGVISYAAGIFDGAPDYSGTTTNADYDDDKALAGRLFVQPFKTTSLSALRGFGFGIGGSYEVDRASTNTVNTGLTPGYLTDGQQKLFSYTNGVAGTGAHWRISPQGYYYYGPVSLLGEYVISEQRVQNFTKGKTAELQNSAWEISGGWVLTGEDASYAGVTPRHSFDPWNGGWGAVQLVGRYAELNVDKAAFPIFADPGTSASSAQAWAVGLNWYLNRDIRVDTSFSRTRFDGGTGAKATVTRQPENVFFTRMQLAF